MPSRYVMKTFHTAHGGKLSVARVLRRPDRRRRHAEFARRTKPGRVSGVAKLMGQATEKRGPAAAGDTVALRQARPCQDRRHARPRARHAARRGRRPSTPYPRGARASRSRPRSARTTSSSATRSTSWSRKTPRSPSMHNPETHEMIVWGQGEMHLRVAVERLADRFGVAIERAPADGRLSRDHPQADRAARAATRSSRAATASSATSCSTSSRCRAATASPSTTRSPAAWCRATTSPRSRRA